MRPRPPAPLCPFAKALHLLLVREGIFSLPVSTGLAPCTHIAIAKALAARCAHSQQALKASEYLEAEMGTLGLGLFLNLRTLPATDACTKLALRLGFPVRQGQHLLSVGLETSHTPQTPSRQAQPCREASRPLPQPASSQPAHWKKMPPQGVQYPAPAARHLASW